MKIKEEVKPKLEEFIMDFSNQYSKRNFDHHQFCNYVYKLLENVQESEEVNEEFCVSKLEDFFGNKSSKFLSDLLSLIKSEEKLEKSSPHTHSHSHSGINEDEEKEIFEHMLKSSSEEESEGKNIFKYKRDVSDDDESSDEDVQEKDRGHKRRKVSHQNSLEKEIRDEKEKNKPNFQKTPGMDFSNRPPFNKKQPQMPGFPYQPPFMAPNPLGNPMFNKKKFPNNMNKKMMMPQFNPMFFQPHLYPPPPMSFPPDYMFPPNFTSTWNTSNTDNKPQSSVNEYDPLNPGNTLQNNPTTNPSMPYYDPSKSNNKPHTNKPYPYKPSDNRLENNPNQINQGVSNLESSAERNKGKQQPNGRSPRKSEKKIIRDTVYIKNIPNYYNSVESLSKFYKKFGSIENIQVEQSKLQASVKFMKPLDAVKAVNSNKKLFGKEDIFVSLIPDEEPPKKNDKNQERTDKTEKNLLEKLEKPGGKNEKVSEKIEKKEKTLSFLEKEAERKRPKNSLLDGKFSKFQEIKNKKEKEASKDMIKKKLANKLKFLLYLKNRVEKQDLKNDLLNEINKIKSFKADIEKGLFDDTIKEVLDKETNDFSFDYTLVLNNLPENMLNYAILQGKLEVYGKIENMKIIKKESKAHVKYISFEIAEKAYLTDHEFLFEFLDKTLLNFLKKDEKITEITQKVVNTEEIENQNPNNANAIVEEPTNNEILATN